MAARSEDNVRAAINCYRRGLIALGTRQVTGSFGLTLKAQAGGMHVPEPAFDVTDLAAPHEDLLALFHDDLHWLKTTVFPRMLDRTFHGTAHLHIVAREDGLSRAVTFTETIRLAPRKIPA